MTAHPRPPSVKESPETTRSRKLLSVLTTASLAAVLPIAFAGPASADSCQPEEIVLGSGNSPYDESQSPFCTVTNGFVYPALGCTGTLIQCVGTTVPVGPDPSNPIPPTGGLNEHLEFYITAPSTRSTTRARFSARTSERGGRRAVDVVQGPCNATMCTREDCPPRPHRARSV